MAGAVPLTVPLAAPAWPVVDAANVVLGEPPRTLEAATRPEDWSPGLPVAVVRPGATVVAAAPAVPLEAAAVAEGLSVPEFADEAPDAAAEDAAAAADDDPAALVADCAAELAPPLDAAPPQFVVPPKSTTMPMPACAFWYPLSS